MSTSVVKISELRRKNGEYIEGLVEFLKSRVDATLVVKSDEITLKREEGKSSPSKSYLRVLLRKFLHKKGLKEEFRVISGQENVFIIKEKT